MKSVKVVGVGFIGVSVEGKMFTDKDLKHAKTYVETYPFDGYPSEIVGRLIKRLEAAEEYIQETNWVIDESPGAFNAWLRWRKSKFGVVS